jgi:hypothetical protein
MNRWQCRVATLSGYCQLRVLVAYEHVSHRFLANLIPINALRNMAIVASTTPLVTMIDVDLLTSRQLGEQLISGDTQLVEHKLVNYCS